MTSSIKEMKLRELIEELLRRTQQGEIRWQATDRPSFYIYALKRGAVRVGRLAEQADGVSITIYDEAQRPIQQLDTISNDPITLRIRELVDAAQESAGISVQVLDSILDELRHKKAN